MPLKTWAILLIKNLNIGDKGSKVELFWGGFGIILSPKP